MSCSKRQRSSQAPGVVAKRRSNRRQASSASGNAGSVKVSQVGQEVNGSFQKPTDVATADDDDDDSAGISTDKTKSPAMDPSPLVSSHSQTSVVNPSSSQGSSSNPATTSETVSVAKRVLDPSGNSSLAGVSTATHDRDSDDASSSLSASVSMATSAILEDKSRSWAPPRLPRQFYDKPGETLARDLLGHRMVRVVDGVRLTGKIVETEAYLGLVDKAAHSYRGRTERNGAMFMQPGTAYVYNIYGMYCCMNISSQGEGCAVLIRSLEPLEGQSKMAQLRRASAKSAKVKPVKVKDLCNGPSKLCQSLNISKSSLNLQDLVTGGGAWLERGEEEEGEEVVVGPRINIASAGDWVHKPLRFYLLGNPCVSVRDRQAEALISASGTPGLKPQ